MRERRPRRWLAMATLALRLGLTCAISGSLVGCVVIDFAKYFTPKKKKKSISDDDRDKGESGDDEVDLGTAQYPSGAKTPKAKHAWNAVRLEPHDYRLAFVMSKEQQDKVLDAHHAFARSVGYEDLGKGMFRWHIPAGCEPDMGCAFGAMSDASTEAMKPISALFRDHAKKHNLKADQVANLVVTFVQQIRYERPTDQPFEILPPANVVAEKRGDCDSKSLLAHLLLREFEIDSVMLSSKAHGHAMLGIAIPAPGKHQFKFGGHTYAFTELTAPNSPIGHINDELLRPDDWKVVPTRWPSGH